MKTGILLFAGAIFVSAFCGCTHVAKSRTKAAVKLEEYSRAFTTAVVDTLQLQPTEERDEFTELALEIARVDQRIEGLPLKPVAVEELVKGGTNLTSAEERAVAAAEGAFRERRLEVDELIAKERTRTDQLVTFGERFEQERNTQRVGWFKRISLSTLVLGSFIALAVFCPAAIPILGRILAWLVGRVPALAGSVGVVSVRAFDAVVKGIERTRASSASAGTGAIEKLGNQVEAGEIPLGDLKLNLSREMDAAHKALVRQRKTALNMN